MKTPCRPWWRNCASETDSEILRIDEIEDGLGPLSANVSKVRELISTFELCHHKAERWIHNIVQAIGQGQTTKGLGTRPSGQSHPVEKVWQSATTALSAWCEGRSDDVADLPIGTVPAKRLLAGLGERSPLKEWQVRRVIQKIQSVSDWAQSPEQPATQYEWMLLGGGDRLPARLSNAEQSCYGCYVLRQRGTNPRPRYCKVPGRALCPSLALVVSLAERSFPIKTRTDGAAAVRHDQGISCRHLK